MSCVVSCVYLKILSVRTNYGRIGNLLELYSIIFLPVFSIHFLSLFVEQGVVVFAIYETVVVVVLTRWS